MEESQQRLLVNYTANPDDSSSMPNSLSQPFGQHLSTNNSRLGLNGALINMSTYSGVSRYGGGGAGDTSVNKDDGSGGSSSGNINSAMENPKSNSNSNIQGTEVPPPTVRTYTAVFPKNQESSGGDQQQQYAPDHSY
ncbi:hypothetical protein FGO68_gene6998 [Halteria grandinella]|uniref:Uncharacterized protein n=1 Tax=Halteria grandinella TaxID=5974 RepID=A0A8J8P4L1_HALGN|nr:hypothetical protein FGO68_gene6998 [Halteria grandinella]